MKQQQIPWYAEGGSGKLGDKVYYRLHGKTFVRKAPGSYNKIASEKQAAVRARMIEADRFAKGIIADPVLKALYEKKSKGRISAYCMAVSEYFSKTSSGASVP